MKVISKSGIILLLAVCFIQNSLQAQNTIGGYSAFTVPVTDYIDFEKENELLVKVDNRFNPDIPPLTADFTFYGGIYRDVWLKAVDAVHFSMNDSGSNAVFVNTPSVNTKNATVQVKATVTNKALQAKKIKVNTLIGIKRETLLHPFHNK